MQFLLSWQKADLLSWAHRAVHAQAPRERLPNAHHDHLEVTLASEAPGPPQPDGPFERSEASVLSYKIFGPEIGEPILASRPVQVGDTIGLRYRFLPFLSLFFASRVVHVFEREEHDGGWRSGFVYQTLEGHPEVGEEIFEIRKDPGGAVSFRIEAWSRPNLWYVKLFSPWARSIQRAAAQSAAANLAHVAVFRTRR